MAARKIADAVHSLSRIILTEERTNIVTAAGREIADENDRFGYDSKK